MGIDVSKLRKDSPLRKKIEEQMDDRPPDTGPKHKADSGDNPAASYKALDLIKPITEMSLQKTFHIDPSPYVRQVHSDRYKKRRPVERYRGFKREVAVKRGQFQMPLFNWWIIFYIEVPKSATDRAAMFHQLTPDKDNLEKAFLDAIFEGTTRDDREVADGRVSKIWAPRGGGRIEVYF